MGKIYRALKKNHNELHSGLIISNENPIGFSA